MDSQSLRRALMSAAMAFLLVGCASTPPDDESPIIVTPSSPATPTVEPSMSTTATPPEAPSPPAATPADLGDPSTWTVDFDRVGPLTIGLTVPELSALTGDLYERVYGDWGGGCLWGEVQETAPLNNFDWLAEGPLGSERVGLIEFYASNGDGEFPRTADGLGLGSSLEEIQAVYGDALELEPEKYDETITQATIRRGEFAMIFNVPEGGAGATRVRVGISPTVFLVEHCS